MAEPVKRLTEQDLQLLVERIKDGRCTPFIGAGVYSEWPTERTAIAQKWALEYGYPLMDGSDLARVARFVTVERDAEYARTKLINEIKQLRPPAFDDPNEPYNILAALPLPIYITTNYDTFLEQALQKRMRNFKAETCRWKDVLIKYEHSHLDDDHHSPSETSPSVYHLYGHVGNPDSLVLTEDDYFQFLIKVSKDPKLIPHRIQRAVTGVSVLLLGYRFDDWDFRALIHLLASSLEISTSSTHVSVQMSPAGYESPAELQDKVQNFFDKYFGSIRSNIRVSWEPTQIFISKLRNLVGG